MGYIERNEIKKEILTKERMLQEVKKDCIQGFIILIVGLTIIIAVNLFIFSIISKFSPSVIVLGIRLDYLIEIIVTAFFSILFLVMLYEVFKNLILIKKNKFRITTDKLVRYEETDDVRLISSVPVYNSIYSDPYFLHFSSYGRFAIPRGKNYKWSKMYCMSDTGVYNYSNIGDEFYLLIIDKRIQAVYNTKLFELID